MAVAGASGAAQVGAPLAGLCSPSRWEATEGAAQGHPARRLLFHGRGLSLLRLCTDALMVGLGTASAVLGAPQALAAAGRPGAGGAVVLPGPGPVPPAAHRPRRA